MSEYDSEKKIGMLPLIGMAILVICAATILFGGSARLTRAGMEQRLQDISKDIAALAASTGREAKFTYGAVGMEGWGFDKRAVVSDVSLEVTEKSLLETDRWSLSTAMMKVLPAPGVPGELSFVFADPVNIIHNGQIKSVMTFSSPLKYSYFDGMERRKHVLAHIINLPPRITFGPAVAAGQADQKDAGYITVSFGDAPVWRMVIRPDTGGREAVYQFRNVKVADANGAEAAIGSLNLNFSELAGKDKRPEGNYSLSVSKLSLYDGKTSSRPYSFNLDFTYSGDAPVMTLGSAVTLGNTDMTLKQLSLSGDGFTINAEGKLAMAVDDPLPSGDVKLHIDNVRQFLSSELLPAPSRRIVADALQKITGQVASSLTNVDIPLKREKKGVLYVGNTTFEALATSMVAGMLTNAVPGAQATPKNGTAPPAAAESSSSAQAAAPAQAKPAAPPSSPSKVNPPAEKKPEQQEEESKQKPQTPHEPAKSAM